MIEETIPQKARLLPLVVLVVAAGVWWALSLLNVFPESALPSPPAVARGFVEELCSGLLLTDLVASLYRVTVGFVLAVFAGVPAGLWLGNHARGRGRAELVLRRLLPPRLMCERT